jgi:hypothetical protein
VVDARLEFGVSKIIFEASSTSRLKLGRKGDLAFFPTFNAFIDRAKRLLGTVKTSPLFLA